jgi:light-regulated signal transduction histidine kinase (bacteriophytochrome)
MVDITERKRAAEQIETLNTDLAARATELEEANCELEATLHELEVANHELETTNRELEAANRELEAFNHTVSHDLRSPLTGITGFSHVLLERHAGRLDEQCTEYIRHILHSAQRMDNLITTLLNFSRLSHCGLHRETVDLSRIANAVAAALRTNEPGRRVTFSIAEGITVAGDARLLRVVLENLFGNAWKYTGLQETAHIEFGSTEINGRAACLVGDNGPGFDMANADKLFRPFQRLHGATEFAGHGVGLATVQRIVERHGGRIWAESAPGKGATFYFTL